MAPTTDPYKLLQVDPEADPEIIAVAYRKLAMRYHPDLASSPEAAAMMVALNRARDLLLDPARRAEHDRLRATGARGPSAPGATTDAGPPSGGAADARRAGPSPAGPAPIRHPAADRPPARPAPAEPPLAGATPAGATSAGRPPGNPSGSSLDFGRYAGWSLGEIARVDVAYLEWLDRMSIGRRYRDEIDILLRQAGRRSASTRVDAPRGLFRRR